MNASLATLVYVCGIAGLFYLNRDKSVRTSAALWLPVVYIGVIGSRSISTWLGIAPTSAGDVQLDGSPVDAAFFAVLLIVGICVLIYRGRGSLRVLNANWAILFYFMFCLLSISWSDFPGVAFKRWIKAIGDLVMVLIVVTEVRPLAALGRLYSRTGFILLPLSVLLIKYYPAIGRDYDPWLGTESNIGVGGNKNVLGVITLVLSLGAVWRVLGLLSSKEAPRLRRHLLAQVALLAICIYILVIADSVTSLVCFAIGSGLMVATNLPFMRRRPADVHVLVLTLMMSAAVVMLSGGGGGMVQALGRNTTFTGRTDIWNAVIPLAPNGFVGAGYESFWLGARLAKLSSEFPGLGLNEAHDGYVEVYLNLGWIGISLIALVLICGYRRSVSTFRRDPRLGGLVMANVLAIATYSITEAGFRMMNPMWVFYLLAIMAGTEGASGVDNKPFDSPRTIVNAVSSTSSKSAFIVTAPRRTVA
jgi:exopolysaccharide production protein ExoQ